MSLNDENTYAFIYGQSSRFIREQKRFPKPNRQIETHNLALLVAHHDHDNEHLPIVPSTAGTWHY